MKPTWIIGAALLASSGAMAADLSGVVLGSHATGPALGKLGIVVSDGMPIEPGQYHGKTRFELVDANTAVTIDSAGNVTELHADFHSLQTDSMHDMAVRKWGKPFDSGTAVLDGILEQLWIWQTRDGAEITLESYDTTIDTGSLTRGSLVIVTKAAADAKRGPQGGKL